MSKAFLAAAAFSLCACAAGKSAPRLSSPAAVAVRIPAASVALAAPPAAAPGKAGRRRPHRQQLLEPAKAASRTGLRGAEGEAAANGSEVYAWSPGRAYRLFTAPGRVSDIALEPGESLVSVAAGDTARWVIGDTASGAGLAKRTHVLVKPAAPGLETNLMIATDRRMYHLELESGARAGMTGISWTYPPEGLIALRASAEGRPANPLADLGSAPLNFGYAIEGDRPDWRPLRAFDDGHQVVIEFPASMEEGQAPPLLLVTPGGGSALVNYRVRGHYYIVDQLFAAAELRLGGKRQQVVRIVRLQSKAKRHGRPL